MDLGSELVQGAWTFLGYTLGRDVIVDNVSSSNVLEGDRLLATSTDPELKEAGPPVR